MAAASEWQFLSVSGKGGKVTVAVDRRLKSGQIDFMELTPDEALGFASDLLTNALRARA